MSLKEKLFTTVLAGGLVFGVGALLPGSGNKAFARSSSVSDKVDTVKANWKDCFEIKMEDLKLAERVENILDAMFETNMGQYGLKVFEKISHLTSKQKIPIKESHNGSGTGIKNGKVVYLELDIKNVTGDAGYCGRDDNKFHQHTLARDVVHEMMHALSIGYLSENETVGFTNALLKQMGEKSAARGYYSSDMLKPTEKNCAVAERYNQYRLLDDKLNILADELLLGKKGYPVAALNYNPFGACDNLPLDKDGKKQYMEKKFHTEYDRKDNPALKYTDVEVAKRKEAAREKSLGK